MKKLTGFLLLGGLTLIMLGYVLFKHSARKELKDKMQKVRDAKAAKHGNDKVLREEPENQKENGENDIGEQDRETGSDG